MTKRKIKFYAHFCCHCKQCYLVHILRKISTQIFGSNNAKNQKLKNEGKFSIQTLGGRGQYYTTPLYPWLAGGKQD
jgi:hypothetical protein